MAQVLTAYGVLAQLYFAGPVTAGRYSDNWQDKQTNMSDEVWQYNFFFRSLVLLQWAAENRSGHIPPHGIVEVL
jgi:hypothetical protein